MNRKEFLIAVWEKGIKPTLLIAVIFLSVKFLYNVITESGRERLVTILIIGLGLLILTTYLIGQLFKSLITRLNSKLPESVKLWLRISKRILDYVSPIILGVIIYYFWQEDWIMTAIVLGVLMIQRIAALIKEEKLAATHNKSHLK